MSHFSFDQLKPTEHMLYWLASKPYGFILESVTHMLNQQIEGSIVQSFIVTSEPDWLTGFLDTQSDNKKLLTRAGCAFECTLSVQAANTLHHLTAVYTWVVVHLDRPEQARQKTWLDIDKDLSTLGIEGALKERIYL